VHVGRIVAVALLEAAQIAVQVCLEHHASP
jgi:hypothetical protein